jgi:hypothetical protein
VGDSAAARGRQLKGQAEQHARGIAGDARRQLRGHAQDETQRAGSALGTAGAQLRALADGRPDEAGVLRDYIETAADAVGHWADTIQERGLDGLLDDLRSFGRRRPGLFLAGALAAGVVAGRFGRNAAQELSGDGTATEHLQPRGSLPAASSPGGTADDHPAGGDEPIGGGVGGDLPTSGDRPADPPRDDDMIVGYASDDSSDVVSPGGTTADQATDDRPVAPPRDTDDVAYRPVDVDLERAR